MTPLIFFAQAVPKPNLDVTLLQLITSLGPPGAYVAVLVAILAKCFSYINELQKSHREERKEMFDQLCRLNETYSDNAKETVVVMTRVESAVDSLKGAIERTKKGGTGEHKVLG